MQLNYSTYLEVCKDAVKEVMIFSSFKKHPAYNYVLEHVSEELGRKYYDIIKTIYPFLIPYISKFATNDTIGSPRVFYIKELNMSISPTTLRYIKVLGDLTTLFGDLKGLDIIEIGGGYGGQCKIIYDYTEPKSYTIVDLPQVLELDKKYLKSFGLRDIEYKAVLDDLKPYYGLCISNYAFTEIGRDFQVMYTNKIINKALRGYITCNFFGRRMENESFTKEEVIALKSNHKLLPEIPMTGINNILYTWDI